MVMTKKKGSRDLTREERQSIALSEGTEVHFVTCPLCGFSRPAGKYLEGTVAFTNIDLNRMHVLSVRRGGGRGIGVFRVDEDSLLLEELKDVPEYQEVIDQIREQAKKVLEILG